MGDLCTISISGLSGNLEKRERVGLCSCSVVVHPYPDAFLKQDFWMCPSRIAMYAEGMLCYLLSHVSLFHSAQSALFAFTFCLLFCLGHWVSGIETGLSILFLYNVEHRKTHLVSQALGGAVCNANISADSPPWLSVHA